ncbi:MAG: hypothetical protein COV29_01865 [Candidatus Yanofskybacteria bacterium CG10_big_fil_rev_8_21_14_0_10_36_16]|uniref:Uncharacterized protein n=1 Tax=Candidatus Yanofskybacteria bacterium CG10_big_fil_rev_8_21_14_0_10_36_16 TaxID=1975096 RepID=A0A2J0Q7F8_9BACT|nr:MAG: hypothetical protein COV29_01865 [Candidatus Yanofskybacteria bacterium CG10_big_fil_rev_8_21_14_0_10_36_16]
MSKNSKVLRILIGILIALVPVVLMIPAWYFILNGYPLAWFALGGATFIMLLLNSKLRKINASLPLTCFMGFLIVALGSFSAIIMAVVSLLSLENINNEEELHRTLTLEDYVEEEINQEITSAQIYKK